MRVSYQKNRAHKYFQLALSIFLAAGAQVTQADTGLTSEGVPTEFRNTTEQLIKHINEGDTEAVQNLIDVRALGYRAAKLLTDKQKERDDYVAGFTKSGTRIAALLTSSIKEGDGNVKLMKYVERGRELRSLTRFNMGDSGFDYLEFVLNADAKGTYRVVDWYQLTAGQLYSVSLGAVSKVFVDPDPGILWSLLGVKKVDRAILEKIKKIGALMREGEYSEALVIFNQLPDKVRNSRIFLTIGINIANKLQDNDLYSRMLTDMATYHADDPAAAFMLLDYYYLQGDMKKALRSVDAIEQRVGTDGMIQMLRANLNIGLNEFEKAVHFAQESTTLEPDLEDGYFSLALAYVGAGKHSEAIDTYQLLETRFGYQFSQEDFAEDPSYEQFRQSKAFIAWFKE